MIYIYIYVYIYPIKSQFLVKTLFSFVMAYSQNSHCINNCITFFWLIPVLCSEGPCQDFPLLSSSSAPPPPYHVLTLPTGAWRPGRDPSWASTVGGARVSKKWGTSQATIGFNTISHGRMTWMIWRYPHDSGTSI